METIENVPEHIAIIMDGNRRWAKERGLSTKQGHKAGAENLKELTRHATKLGVKYLTVYAFSTENWKRSEEEVGALMILFKNYLNDLVTAVDTEDIRVKIFGRIEALPKGLQESIYSAMEKTKHNKGTTLSVAINYGGRDEITKAIKEISKDVKEEKISIENITEKLVSSYMYTKEIPDPDLLIRTSGELRLSNFLPWQLVYSEFIFIDKYWPDFKGKDLEEAIETYEKRNRKFGGK